MAVTDIIKIVGTGLGKAGLKISKHAPEILLGTGVAGVVTGSVLACKATLKTRDDILESKAHYIESEDEKKRELTRDIVLAAAKNYSVPVAVFSAGMACIFAGHNVQKSRLAGAIAAYNALDAGFRQYRERVIEDQGEDADRGYRYGISVEKEETVKKLKNGTEKTVKKDVETIDPDGLSVYARCYDQFNSDQWVNDPTYNLAFLKSQQEVATQILHTRGYLFLNEVYKMLGFKEVPAGQLVGWVDGMGDDFVDFGIYNMRNRKALDFVNGAENTIWLDFNVDGIMWDLI